MFGHSFQHRNKDMIERFHTIVFSTIKRSRTNSLGYVEERSHGHIHVLELGWVSRMVSPTTTVATSTEQHNTTGKSAARVLSRVEGRGRAVSDAEEVDFGVGSK
ncbi:unnamed protein product [Citrullus colocynthis]|uniref:Uncharacterized protein n=1 Tax=Citrullus colocynthis TaxID=252529 RepID=A0ABP0XR53_9ROSI